MEEVRDAALLRLRAMYGQVEHLHEDIASECCLRALRNPRAVNKSWVSCVATNAIIDELRRHARFLDRQQAVHEHWSRGHPRNPLEALVEVETRASQREFLASLADGHPSFAAILDYWLTDPDATQKGVAQAIGMNYNTLKTHLHRARQRAQMGVEVERG
uniref:Putative sigma-70 region domain containing protein n=1 Tax=viral metagenome TaxID=1070528 RepID=A0A6M3J141_9ZZZZ